MKKIIGTILLMMFINFNVNAQDITHKNIKFKHGKGYIYVDKKETFKLKYSASYFYIYDLKTNEELMHFYMNDNETFNYLDDDYVKVYFEKSGKVFESKSHYRVIMAQLINNKIFDSNWNINEENVDKFIKKYDENISNRTIRN